MKAIGYSLSVIVFLSGAVLFFSATTPTYDGKELILSLFLLLGGPMLAAFCWAVSELWKEVEFDDNTVFHRVGPEPAQKTAQIKEEIIAVDN